VRAQDRIGSTGNQFALSTLLGTLSILPFFLFTEAKKFGTFMELFKTVRRVVGWSGEVEVPRLSGEVESRVLSAASAECGEC
jgi:hypothetical protein